MTGEELRRRYTARQRDFSYLNLSEVNISGLDPDFDSSVYDIAENGYPDFTVNLSGINLCGANLTKANLQMMVLLNADLSETILTGAKLTKSNLTNANLSYATLIRADLSGCDLSNTNLSYSDLTQACLSCAQFCLTKLSIPETEGSILNIINRLRN
jgi:uncharacterized protein YjbI with pentapeptide repeats